MAMSRLFWFKSRAPSRGIPGNLWNQTGPSCSQALLQLLRLELARAWHRRRPTPESKSHSSQIVTICKARSVPDGALEHFLLATKTLKNHCVYLVFFPFESWGSRWS